MGILLLLPLLFFSSFASAHSVADYSDANLKTYSYPIFEGDTLYLWGKIDGNMYNSLVYDAPRLEKIKYIDLLSFGGDVNYALLIGEKIKSLKKITRISQGNLCASACVVLFAAGIERQAAADARIGIHAARLSKGYAKDFAEACQYSDEKGFLTFDENKPGCSLKLAMWTQMAAEQTDKMFSFYENNGVSTQLRTDYFAQPLVDPTWGLNFNVLKTPDWLLYGPDALKYGLATEIILM